jgi:two-component system, chemotaxis family, protein-glutamate methylesterase/glutaminase
MLMQDKPQDKPITILIADDSIIIRGIVNRILSDIHNLKVVGTAIDGIIAVKMSQELQPDFVILDINMPRKDGLTALPEILSISPKTKVIIASAMTNKNAKISMQALELGASECLHMPDSKNQEEIKRFARDLINAIMALSGKNPTLIIEANNYQSLKSEIQHIKTVEVAKGEIVKKEIIKSPTDIVTYDNKFSHQLDALAIASSTGGPNALAHLFRQLNGQIPNVPIFITQHMPPNFTNILANNLSIASGINCKEGIDGEIVQAKHVYIAPGDYHMTPIKQGEKVIIKINQNPMENYCRPSADPMMRSLLNIYGKNMMLVVLTGMGHDGLAGARLLASVGGIIVAQDKESSVVWGMPKAVAEAGIASSILPLDKIADYIINAFGGGGASHAN